MELLSVQREALHRSNRKREYGFFLEMGLGKTLLTLYEFSQELKAGRTDVLIIFCPNSLISTWKDEVRKHGFPFEVVVKPESLSLVRPGMVLIYNYESIIATSGKLLPIIVSTYRCYLAFDESVQIKNFQSARWKNLRSWAKFASHVRLLSGRPMVQSPMDLWTQLTLLNAAVHSSPFAFRNTYCQLGGWQGKQVVGPKNLDKLREVLKQVSFHAKKKNWTDLPEKIYPHPREYKLTPEQLRIYQSMFNDMVVEIGTTVVSVQQAVHKTNKLQQAGSGIMIDEQGTTVEIMPFKDVPKVKLVEEILDELDSKVIIFAHYRASVEALHKHFGGALINSGMTEDEIAGQKIMFNQDYNCKILVAQLSSAKYGHTLIGTDEYPCHTSIYFENNYSLDARIQSEDRNHRHGQKNIVTYIDLVGTPVEKKIINSLQDKNRTSLSVMETIKGELNVKSTY